ncbi:MAG: hypothetical protein IID61_11225 [SAR324 cluster bacterium]|nr:hypothetical protein [SAR324 cluster bacterium]
MAFDTLTYAKKLQEAGVPPQQAETHAWALKETVEDTLATKQDLRELNTRIDGRFTDLETRMDGRFKEVDNRFNELETRMDGRFKEVDNRFTALETRIDGRFNELETRFEGRFRLVYWMLGFNLALTLITFSVTAGLLLKLLAG